MNDRFPKMRAVLDETACTDLSFRREVKYAVPGADVGKLRLLLDTNLKRIRYNERVSTVRSIYFDDWRLSACQESLAGVGRRRKVRLRWYDEPDPPSVFFFEIKWRDGLASGKQRIQIEADEKLSVCPYPGISMGVGDALPTPYAAVWSQMSEPVVLVEYKREHFSSRHTPLRVTLDYDLVFYDQYGARYPSLSFPQPMSDFAVIEAKVPVGAEGSIKEAFHPMTPRATRSSKYLSACQLVGSLARASITV